MSACLEVNIGSHHLSMDHVASPLMKSGVKMSSKPRKSSIVRSIPRSTTDVNKTKGVTRRSSEKSTGRTRTMTESSVASAHSETHHHHQHRRNRAVSNASTTVSEGVEPSPLRKLRDLVLEKHERRGLNLLNSYVKNKLQFAKYENNVTFLESCHVLQVVPRKYRLSNKYVRNTKPMIRSLDRFSFQIMSADLRYQRTRRAQVARLLIDKQERMREKFDNANNNEHESSAFSNSTTDEIIQAAEELFERRSKIISDRLANIFDMLLKEYDISDEERQMADERLQRMAERRQARRHERAATKTQGRSDHYEDDAEQTTTSTAHDDTDDGGVATSKSAATSRRRQHHHHQQRSNHRRRSHKTSTGVIDDNQEHWITPEDHQKSKAD